MTNSRNVALQGLKKTPLAIAVQGFLDGEDEDEQPKPVCIPFYLPSKKKRVDTDNDVLLFIV